MTLIVFGALFAVVLLGIGAYVGVRLVLGAIRMEGQLRSGGYVRSRMPTERKPDHVFDPATSESHKAGMRIGGHNTSWPFVTATIDRAWLHLQGIGQVYVPRTLVTGIRVTEPRFGTGIGFASADGEFDGVLWWTREPESALAALDRFGWRE